jgi:hypothetical protein
LLSSSSEFSVPRHGFLEIFVESSLEVVEVGVVVSC